MEHMMKEHAEDLEREREHLYTLAAVHGLQHPIVIKQSELLDEMINLHNQMILRNSKSNYILRS